VSKPTDARPVEVRAYLHPIATRVPLKFGREVLTDVQVLHVEMDVESRTGRRARGQADTPLNVQWAWPADTPYSERLDAMVGACGALVRAWVDPPRWGHPLELGHLFDVEQLPVVAGERVPRLAALVCNSAFDLALHDAYGRLHGVDVYETYTGDWISRDLQHFFADDDAGERFRSLHPADFLTPRAQVPSQLPVWHLVGGLDAIDPSDLTGEEPDDGHPVLLRDWIRRDGLKCLKVKLRGSDPVWDYDRLVRVGRVADDCDVTWLCADFNCTVDDPRVVEATIDRLRRDEPAIAAKLLYVEQPFPAELAAQPADVRALAERTPLFLDESAHDWQHVRLGHARGWNGVALKTCKTQTGAMLSFCWARAHGMQVMVQDLTNPMLATVPHVRLAAHTNTIMGVECNATQFYPDGSALEARVHPGLYSRRNGVVDLSTLSGPGFGYRAEEVGRQWTNPFATATA
jgi:L-alanine-DL-glutamate epimerase-like enolase superfamily enzyme